MNPHQWPEQKEKLAAVFRQKTRDEWCELLEGTDVCFAPVLGLNEAPDHPHNRARGSFTEIEGITQHTPTPRFSRTPADEPEPGRTPGTHTRAVLRDAGWSEAEVDTLIETGAVAENS